MRLDQFDKLKLSTEAIMQSFRQFKYQIIKLEKENRELKKKIDLLAEKSGDIATDDFVGLQNENERLTKKNQTVKQHLESLVNRLEHQEL